MPIRVRVELDADTTRLANTIQQAVAKGFQGGSTAGLATNPQSVVRQILGTQGAGMRGYRDPMGGTSLPSSPAFLSDPRFFLSNGPKPPNIAAYQAQRTAQNNQFLKNIGFAGIPLGSPGSLFGNLFASRQIFSGLSGATGQRLLGAAGIGGTAATAAATGALMVVLLAIGATFKILEHTVKEVIKSFEDARKLYAKSLMSGLGLQFTIGRSNLADVLGVSEKDVFQFGAAVGQLSPKLQFASNIMAKTTPALTGVAFETTILEKDMQALFMTLASDVAPALRIVIAGLDSFAQGLTRIIKHIGDAISAHPKLFGILFGAAGAAIPGLSSLLEAGAKNDIGNVAAPQGMMKQLPVSALERMGLVIGGFGGSQDYSRRIAVATEKTARGIAQLAQKGVGFRANQFGMSTTTSNP